MAHAMFNGWFGLKIKSYIEILALLPHIIDKRRDIQLSRRVSDREIVRLYEGELRVGGLQNPILDYVLSPLLNLYWKLILYNFQFRGKFVDTIILCSHYSLKNV